MQSRAVTVEEFNEQMARLHKVWPFKYSRKYQVEIALLVAGVSQEWLENRVSHILSTGRPGFDWKYSASIAPKYVQSPVFQAEYQVDPVTDPKPYSYDEYLRKMNVRSAVEIIDRNVGGKNETKK